MIEATAGNGGGEGLTIGQVAEGTGVAVATLRMWEARYGFPEPRRLASGHRRYREEDRLLVAEVLRQRAAGLSLEAAIARAREAGAPPESSLFAGLRRRHPELVASRSGSTAARSAAGGSWPAAPRWRSCTPTSPAAETGPADPPRSRSSPRGRSHGSGR